MSFEWIALIIFIITYLGIIFTRLPWVNIDRPSAAFFGAVSMILFGVLSFDEAIHAIDFHTITLLLGMMIIIATLQADGLFNYLTEKSIKIVKNQHRLLTYIVWLTGVGSAFLVNDAVVLMFTPIIIMICRASNLNPVPYLIAEILSSNIGSVMTITGNPQNMLIGIHSSLSYGEFMMYLFPISIIGLTLISYFIRWYFKTEFAEKKAITLPTEGFSYRVDSLRYSFSIFLGVIVMFFLGKILNLSISLISLVGASLIIIFGHIKPRRIIDKVDWVLILFFASLFVVVKGFEKAGWMNYLINAINVGTDLEGILKIHFVSLVGSQIVSNVPFTLIMLPLLKIESNTLWWLSLASASTLAGNATIIGAIANLIVLESARKYGIRIKFWEFTKPAVVVTLMTFVISVIILFIWSLV
ncbi:MAG: SLC13 family permease [Bacteroidales bacterium]|nr:SLC13 family permease [Bacteroidales bacterium]